MGNSTVGVNNLSNGKRNMNVANVAVVKNTAVLNKNKNKNVANVVVAENIAVLNKNKNKNNVSVNMANAVLEEINVKNHVSNQAGGVAPVSYSVPYNQRQPSEAVMEWATTAGAETPSAAEMRNVAHGGARRTRKNKKAKKAKKNKSLKKAKSHKKSKKAHKKGKKSLKGKKQKKQKKRN